MPCSPHEREEKQERKRGGEEERRRGGEEERRRGGEEEEAVDEDTKGRKEVKEQEDEKRRQEDRVEVEYSKGGGDRAGEEGRRKVGKGGHTCPAAKWHSEM
eukprot:765008-Hanusia_phi.AAC.2